MAKNAMGEILINHPQAIGPEFEGKLTMFISKNESQTFKFIIDVYFIFQFDPGSENFGFVPGIFSFQLRSSTVHPSELQFI